MQLTPVLLKAIESCLAGIATPEEEKLANDWYYSFNDEEINIPADIVHLRSELEKRIWMRLMRTTAPRSNNRGWWRLSAAAAILLLVTAGAFLFFNRNPEKNKVATLPSRPGNDVPPGGNKAILVLGNGKTVVLDSVQNGAFIQQGATKIVKPDNGTLAYNAGEGNTAALFYNTLSTPFGGQFRLVLPDGSKVWLNAASSIKYPTAFTGRERKVEITGEVYFEVAPRYAPSGDKLPFKVDILPRPGDASDNRTEVEVLGTHFNVMAYDDEPGMKTTLLEGSVRLTKGSATGLLQPGQALALDRNSERIQVIDNADIDETMAWKEGWFQFKSTDVQTVMRQVARWYNVKVVYEGTVSQYFNGKIPRSVSAATLFKVLELAGGVHFKIAGRTITVTR